MQKSGRKILEEKKHAGAGSLLKIGGKYGRISNPKQEIQKCTEN